MPSTIPHPPLLTISPPSRPNELANASSLCCTAVAALLRARLPFEKFGSSRPRSPPYLRCAGDDVLSEVAEVVVDLDHVVQVLTSRMSSEAVADEVVLKRRYFVCLCEAGEEATGSGGEGEGVYRELTKMEMDGVMRSPEMGVEEEDGEFVASFQLRLECRVHDSVFQVLRFDRRGGKEWEMEREVEYKREVERTRGGLAQVRKMLERVEVLKDREEVIEGFGLKKKQASPRKVSLERKGILRRKIGYGLGLVGKENRGF